MPNPVVTTIIVYYKLEHVQSLWLHTQKRMDMYKVILENMKMDYEYIYKQTNPTGKQIINMSKIIDNQKVEFLKIYDKRPMCALDPRTMHTQLSMALQKKNMMVHKSAFII